MGMIINIDEALKLRTDFNVLGEPLNLMLKDMQEAWEKKNPIDLLFVRNTIDKFQETYTSSIGFDRAFTETADYAIGPIFNTEEGFSSTYRTRTFQGGFIITLQALEDRRYGKIKDDASQYMRRWHGDLVDYAMIAISGGFGVPATYGDNAIGKSSILLKSADTTDGKIATETKNPLFYKAHTIVKRKDMSSDVFNAAKQSNLFRSAIDLTSSDPGKIAKLADVINQVITIMENYKDDNNKRAGVVGQKTIVAPNDARLKAALETAISLEMFNDMGQKQGINPAYKRAVIETTPYLLDIPQGAGGVGFFIIDKAYNASNHGLEFTERIPLTIDVEKTTRPKGISYDGRQRFDINVSSWRGIAYVYIGEVSPTPTDWNYTDKFTAITPSATLVAPVSIVGETSLTPVALSMTAVLDDASEVNFVGTHLALPQNSVLSYVKALMNVSVELIGTPKSYVTVNGTEYDHGLVTVDGTNDKLVKVTPTGTNGQCPNLGTFSLRVPANIVRNKLYTSLTNEQVSITLTVTA